MPEEWKERELAARIMDKHLRRLYMKAVLKGYDILKADNLPVLFENITSLRIREGHGKGMLQLEGRRTGGNWEDISSKPEMFEHARNTLNAIETLIDSSPRPPHPELSERNLLRLRTLLTEFKKSNLPGRVFFSGTIQHDFADGLPFTTYGLDKNFYDATETMEIEKILHSTEKVLTFLKSRANGMEETDQDMQMDLGRHIALCNDYLVFLEENTLLREHELHARGEKGLLYSELLPSLDEHMKALFPSPGEAERMAGNISRLKKDEQQNFLVMHIDDPVPLPSFGDAPVTEFTLSLSWADRMDRMHGAYKSWTPVVNSALDVAAFLREGTICRMKCDIRMGDNIRRGVLRVAHLGLSKPDPRMILSTLAFLALHRTIIRGGQEHSPVSESISSVSQDVAAAICGTFRAHLNNDGAEDPTELWEMREKMKTPVPRRLKKEAAAPANGTMGIEAARKVLSNVAMGLSEGLAAIREQLADTHTLVATALSRAKNQVDLVPGWTYSLSLEQKWRKDICEALFRLNYPPGLLVDFKNTTSVPVLTEKLCEAILVTPAEGIVKITPALAPLTDDEGKKAGSLLRQALEDFAREIRHRQSEMRDHYYQVLSRDFPEELFEGYMRSTPGM